MRIYNGTNSVLSLPLMGNERITIAPKTPSGHILCSPGIVSLLITSYTTDEIALIVSGPFEISTCANVSAAVGYVVQSLEEAIKRFIPEKKEEPAPITEEEITPEKTEEEPKTEEPKEDPKDEELKEEPKKEEQPVKEKPLRKVKDKKNKSEKKKEN